MPHITLPVDGHWIYDGGDDYQNGVTSSTNSITTATSSPTTTSTKAGSGVFSTTTLTVTIFSVLGAIFLGAILTLVLIKMRRRRYHSVPEMDIFPLRRCLTRGSRNQMNRFDEISDNDAIVA